jgi:pimeloyl-ACP methyl ester carboxylesterase
MHKVEIRTGVWMAYEDHWFGKPWTVPDTVVMVHGNSESSRAWTAWVPHLAGKYRVIRLDLPGFGASTEPPDYGWSASELAADIGRFLDALEIETCHLIGAKYGGSACNAGRQRSAAPVPVAVPVRIPSPRQRQRERRRHSCKGRSAVGRRDHASAPRQLCVR